MNKEAAPDSPAMGPQISVETRFMQNYRVAAAVDGGSDIAAIANGSGQVEIFTVGHHGAVCNFYPDPSSTTGYNGFSMGIQAETIAAGTDNQGRILLFAGSGTQLTYVREINQPNARWSKPETVEISSNTNPVRPPKIVRIKTHRTSNQLAVGIVLEISPTTGVYRYGFALSVWSAPGPTFYGGDANFHSSPHWTWLNDDRVVFKTSFGCFTDRGLFQCGLWDHTTHRDPVTAKFTPIDIANVTDSKGNCLSFAILSDGNLYQLTGSGPGPFSWLPLSEKMDFRQLQVVKDASGQVRIFAVSTNNTLYDLHPNPGSPRATRIRSRSAPTSCVSERPPTMPAR